jgi:hypothetical protein
VSSAYQPFVSISRVEEESTDAICRVVVSLSPNLYLETSISTKRKVLPDLRLLAVSR